MSFFSIFEICLLLDENTNVKLEQKISMVINLFYHKGESSSFFQKFLLCDF